MTRTRGKLYLLAAISSLVFPMGCRSRETGQAVPSPAASDAARPELIAAVLKGDLAAVQILLNKGADSEARNPKDGRTALMLAALKRQRDMVNLLLQRGAKLESQDDEGMTALMWAAFGGSPEIVQALLEKGAKTDVKSKSGETALEWGRDYPDVTALLKKADKKK